MQIKQLGMCTTIIKFKNFKKKCVFFVVPGNSQALLGMPDMVVLNIINLNIDSIEGYKGLQNKQRVGNTP